MNRTIDPATLDTLKRAGERVIRHRQHLYNRRYLPRADMLWLAEVAQMALLHLIAQHDETLPGSVAAGFEDIAERR